MKNLPFLKSMLAVFAAAHVITLAILVPLATVLGYVFRRMPGSGGSESLWENFLLYASNLRDFAFFAGIQYLIADPLSTPWALLINVSLFVALVYAIYVKRFIMAKRLFVSLFFCLTLLGIDYNVLF
jgi:hypothetical protein